MDRPKLERLLALAEAHVARSEAQIEKRKAALAASIGPHDALRADDALRQFKELHKLHLEDRERIRRQLQLFDGSSAHPLVPADVPPEMEALSKAEVALQLVLQATNDEPANNGGSTNSGQAIDKPAVTN